MKIKSDEITSVIRQEIEQYSGKLEISEVGQVVEVGDGILDLDGECLFDLVRSRSGVRREDVDLASF